MIGQQAKKLEELDSLYRDEALMRKKIHNQMEDMKGKIRVYCRVRPILKLEIDKGQAGERGAGWGPAGTGEGQGWVRGWGAGGTLPAAGRERACAWRRRQR